MQWFKLPFSSSWNTPFAALGCIKAGPTLLSPLYQILDTDKIYLYFTVSKLKNHDIIKGTSRIYTTHHLRSPALHQNLMMGSKFSELTTKGSIDCLQTQLAFQENHSAFHMNQEQGYPLLWWGLKLSFSKIK